MLANLFGWLEGGIGNGCLLGFVEVLVHMLCRAKRNGVSRFSGRFNIAELARRAVSKGFTDGRLALVVIHRGRVDVEFLAFAATVVFLVAVVEGASVKGLGSVVVAGVSWLALVGWGVTVQVPGVVDHEREVVIIVDGGRDVVVVLDPFVLADMVVVVASKGFKGVQEFLQDFFFGLLAQNDLGVFLRVEFAFDVADVQSLVLVDVELVVGLFDEGLASVVHGAADDANELVV